MLILAGMLIGVVEVQQNSIAVMDNLVFLDLSTQIPGGFHTRASCSYFTQGPAINTASMRPVHKWI